MATHQQLVMLLQDAQNALRINSGALTIIGQSMGPEVYNSIQPGLAQNAQLINEIEVALKEFYADEVQPGS